MNARNIDSRNYYIIHRNQCYKNELNVYQHFKFVSTVSGYLQYSFTCLLSKSQIGHYKEDTKRSSITCQDITQGQMSNEVALRMVEWDQTADETIDIHTSMIVWLGKLSTLFHMGSPWFSSLIYTKSQVIFSGCNLCLRKSETWLHPLCKVGEDLFFYC